jgi:Beta-eliminating lyase
VRGVSAVVNLHSDAVARPTPAMRDAMYRAELGGDVFDDDPSALALANLVDAHAPARRHGLAIGSERPRPACLDVDRAGVDRAIAAVRGFFRES